MKPQPLAAWVPPLTPVSYYAEKRTRGYVEKRLVRSYLRKLKGQRRRKRVNVYKAVKVPGRRVLTWIVQVPEFRERWLNVADYQQGIEAQKEFDGFPVTERDMEIFHSSPASDVIHAVEEFRSGKSFYFGEPTLFVWKDRKLPTKLKVYKRARPFRMVRVWFWVYHNDLEEYRIWCRSSLVSESNFREAWDFAQALYSKVENDIEEAFDYLEVHGLVAWTAYTLGERARRRDPRAVAKESGGVE